MRESTFLIDPATGRLLVEGTTAAEVAGVTADLLPAPVAITCAQPGPAITPVALTPIASDTRGTILRIAGIAHGSVVNGPGRRSTVAVQGCVLACTACAVPLTHDPTGGVAMDVDAVVAALLDPAGAPRDGVSVLGGEPMLQPAGLAILLHDLKAHGLHTVVYTGYTLEALARRPEPTVREALRWTDLLIDGPFVVALADGAGPWRGSRNQRVIRYPYALLVSGTRPVSTGSSAPVSVRSA